MNIFKKLFKRNKNTIEMSAEEAYSAPSETAVPEEVAPAPVPEKPKITVTNRMFACMDEKKNVNEYIRSLLISSFKSLTESEDTFEGNLPDDTRVSVTIVRDRDELASLSGALAQKFEKAPLQSRDVLNAALMQISLFNLCFIITVTVTEGAPSDGIDAFLKELCSSIKGFYTRDDDKLYRWDSKLLISVGGETDFNVFMPVKCCSESPEQTKQDAETERKMRSLELMADHLVSYKPDFLPKLKADALSRRANETVISRAAALLCCALTAKAYLSPKEILSPATWCASLIERFDLNYGVKRAFSPREKAYIAFPTQAKHAEMLLCAEGCATLLWTLGLTDIPWPDLTIDLAQLNSVLKDTSAGIVEKRVKPLSDDMLLDAHDLIVRLHSALVMSSPEDTGAARLNDDVVYARHYALNWLLGVNGITEWDNVLPVT